MRKPQHCGWPMTEEFLFHCVFLFKPILMDCIFWAFQRKVKPIQRLSKLLSYPLCSCREKKFLRVLLLDICKNPVKGAVCSWRENGCLCFMPQLLAPPVSCATSDLAFAITSFIAYHMAPQCEDENSFQNHFASIFLPYSIMVHWLLGILQMLQSRTPIDSAYVGANKAVRPIIPVQHVTGEKPSIV